MAIYYESFEDLMNNIKDPINNKDFYKMILIDYEWYKGTFFSAAPYKFSKYSGRYMIDLFKFGIKENIVNVSKMSDEEFLEAYGNKIRDCDKKEYLQELTSLVTENDPKAFTKLLVSNEKFLSKILRLKVKEWFYFDSRYLNPGLASGIDEKEAMHTLRMAVDSKERGIFVQKLLEKLNELNMPYTFKVNTGVNKNDSIVIYLATEEQVVSYTNIINSILEDNPKLTEHMFKVSPHYGLINETLGYCFNPLNDMDYSRLLYDIVKEAHEKLYTTFIQVLSDRENYDSVVAATKNVEERISKSFPSYEEFCELKQQLEETDYKNIKIMPRIFMFCGMGYFCELLKDQIRKIIREKYNDIYPDNFEGLSFNPDQKLTREENPAGPKF